MIGGLQLEQLCLGMVEFSMDLLLSARECPVTASAPSDIGLDDG
jgi:hypothetical protein